MSAHTALRWQILLFCALTFGCSSPRPTREYPAPEPITIPALPDSVWPSVIEVVTARNLTIKTIDRTSGFLQTEPMTGESVEYWDCGEITHTESSYGGRTVSTRKVPVRTMVFTIITVAVTPIAAGSTRVRVMTTPRARTLTGTLCNSKGVFEMELMREIVEQWHENQP